MQQELYQRSDYNFVRIEWGREQPQDKDTFNKYTRAAATFKSWLEQRVLVADEKPSLYIDEHTFTYQGKTLRRRNHLLPGQAGGLEQDDYPPPRGDARQS